MLQGHHVCLTTKTRNWLILAGGGGGGGGVGGVGIGSFRLASFFFKPTTVIDDFFSLILFSNCAYKNINLMREFFFQSKSICRFFSPTHPPTPVSQVTWSPLLMSLLWPTLQPYNAHALISFSHFSHNFQKSILLIRSPRFINKINWINIYRFSE